MGKKAPVVQEKGPTKAEIILFAGVVFVALVVVFVLFQ